MTITPYAVGAARAVRLASLVAAIALLVAFVAIRTFAAQYGEPASAVVLDSSVQNAQLAGAVALQEAHGLRCSQKPAMTDVVLVENALDQAISVMTFADAVTALAERSGSIRQFCV